MGESPTTPQPSEDTLKTHMIINLNSSMLFMTETITRMAESVQAVAVKIKDIEARRRRDRIVFTFAIAVLAVVLLNYRQVATSNSKQLQITTEQLRILRNATSPEAQAAAKASQDRAVLQIKCDGDDNLRRALVALKANIPDINVPETRPDCKEIGYQ